MRDDPVSRFLRTLDSYNKRARTAPLPPPPERPRGRGFGGSFDTVDLGQPTEEAWSPQREFGEQPVTPGAQILPPVRTTAPDPSGRGLASAIAYRLDQPRRIAQAARATGQEFGETEAQSMASLNRNRAPGEFEGGFSAGMDVAPQMAFLSVAPNVGPLKPLRREAEEYMTRQITRRAREVATGGGDPSSGRFQVGLISGGALPTMAASGAVIGGVATGLSRGGAALQAMRGQSAVANALRATGGAVARSPRAIGYAASAGVTGLTTTENDQTLTSLIMPERAKALGMDRGSGAAMAEDLALNAAGDLGLGGVKRLLTAARKATDGTSQLLTREVREQRALEAKVTDLTRSQAIPPERRLPAYSSEGGVREAPADPNGRVLVTPPPAEVSPNAMPVLTDGEAQTRVNILRKRIESARQAFGIDLTTQQALDPTKQAQRDFWKNLLGTQADVAEGERAAQAAADAQRAADADAVDAATNPARMPLRDLLRQNTQRGIGYGLAGMAGAEAVRELTDDEEQSGAAPVALALTAAGAFGRRAKTASLGGRLTKVVDALGNAKVLNHGTTAGFDVADPKRFQDGAWGRGYYWTENSEVAGGSVRGMIRDWEQADGRYADAEGGYAGGGYHSPAGGRPPEEFFKARSEMIWADERLRQMEQAAGGDPKKQRELKPTIDALRTQRAQAEARMNAVWPEGLQPNVRRGRAIADRVFDIDERITINLDREPEPGLGTKYDVSGELAAEFGKNPDLARIHGALIEQHGSAAGERFFEALSDLVGDNPDIEDMRRVEFTGGDVHTAIGHALNDTQMGGIEAPSKWTGHETRRSPDTNKVLQAAGYDAITHMDSGYMVNNADTRGRDRKARTWVFFGDETDQIRSPYGPAEDAPPLANMSNHPSLMTGGQAARAAGVGAAVAGGAEAMRGDDEGSTAEAGMGGVLLGAAAAAAAASSAAGKRVLGRIGAAAKRTFQNSRPNGTPLPESVLKTVPDVTPPPYRAPSQRGAEGFGKATPYGPMNPDDYLNFENGRWQELRNDPDGRLALTQRVQQLVQERGATFRTPKPFAVVEEEAKRLGLDADELMRVAKKRGLRPEEQLAAANIVAQNMDNIVEYQRRLSDPATPASERTIVQRNLTALEAQTNELLWANLTERTEAGRNLAYQRIAASRTMDHTFWLGQAAKNLGSTDMLRVEHMAEINRFIAAKDRMGLASYVASLKPGKAGRIVTTLYKAGLLTNPATHASNATSNALMGAAEVAKDAPASLADRIATGLMNAALGGDAVKRSRDFDARLAIASAKGAREGLKDFKLALQGKDTNLSAMLKHDMTEEIRLGDTPAAKMVELYMNGPFRLLRAADAPFRTAALMRSLDQQRRLAGMPQANTLEEMLKNATPDMTARALADAEIATFQNASALGAAASGLKRGLARTGEAGRIAGEVLLPFTQTPGAVAGAVVRYSPLGLAHAGTDAVRAVIHTLKTKSGIGELAAMKQAGSGATDAAMRVKQEQVREQIKLLQELKNNMVDRAGRGALGTSIMGLGMIMASNGMLTTKPGRTDRVQRDMGETLGDPGNTIDWGPLNTQIDRLAPIANLLLLGAYLVKGYEAENPEKERQRLEAKAERAPEEELKLQGMRNQREEDGARLFESSYGQAIATALGSIGSVIVEQPVFSGVSRVQDILNDPLKAAQRGVYSQIGSVIPAGAAAVARTIDPSRRDAETLGETMRSRIPGLSRSVPEKLDALGEPVRESLGVRLANLISPARISTDRTVGDTEGARVRRLLEQQGIAISRVSQDKKGGETLAESRERQRMTGEAIRMRLAGITESDLAQLPAEQRADYLRKQISRARSQATRRAKGQRRMALFDQLDDVFDNQ